MLIEIKPAEGSVPATWAMIELQGEIERSIEGNANEGFDVGTFSAGENVRSVFHRPLNITKLNFYLSTTLQGSLYLTIGYHQLEGKAQTLKKPLAVLSKVDSVDAVTGEPKQEYKVLLLLLLL